MPARSAGSAGWRVIQSAGPAFRGRRHRPWVILLSATSALPACPAILRAEGLQDILREISTTMTLRPAQELHPRSMPRGSAGSRPVAMGVIVGVDGSAGSAAALHWAAAVDTKDEHANRAASEAEPIQDRLCGR
ncbi:MAG: hypothetical protein ACRDNF_11050 [Streptosporangiaceae bacterium]